MAIAVWKVKWTQSDHVVRLTVRVSGTKIERWLYHRMRSTKRRIFKALNPLGYRVKEEGVCEGKRRQTNASKDRTWQSDSKLEKKDSTKRKETEKISWKYWVMKGREDYFRTLPAPCSGFNLLGNIDITACMFMQPVCRLAWLHMCTQSASGQVFTQSLGRRDCTCLHTVCWSAVIVRDQEVIPETRVFMTKHQTVGLNANVNISK